MQQSTIAHNFSLLVFFLGAVLLNGCQTPGKPDFTQNISSLEHSLIQSINQNGPGDRFVINQVQVHDEVVDRYTISLSKGAENTALSQSGSGRIGAGSVVQFCGWGEFLGHSIYTEYPYLCKRGDGLVFGVTRIGWVHLYGTGEVAGKRISIARP